VINRVLVFYLLNLQLNRESERLTNYDTRHDGIGSVADLHLDILEWLCGVLVEILFGLDHRLTHVTFALDLVGRLSVSSQVDLSLECFLAQAARERFVASVLSHVSNSGRERRREKRENEFACQGFACGSC
jgi:hypothetical protein